MLRLYFVTYVVSIFVFGYSCQNDFRQERAKLKYSNPKYIKDVIVVTGRKSHRDPYLTNMSATLLMPYGNNVTVRVSLNMTSGGDFKVASKLCDCIKHKWMRDYTKSFTNLTIGRCPVPPGRYMYMNMELPPRDIPIPLADDDYWISYELYLTTTKLQILEVKTLLRFDSSKISYKKGKKG